MKKIRLKLIVFLFSVCLFGQIKNDEAIEKMSVDDLSNIYFNEKTTNFEKLKYANILIKQGTANKDKIQIAKGHCWIALLYFDVNNEKAISELNSALQFSKNLKNDKFPMIVYFQKAIVLRKQRKYKESIENFILAEKSNNGKDGNYSNTIKLNIAVIKSNYLGDVREGIEMLKECLSFYKNKDVANPEYSSTYHEVIFDISEAYRLLSKNDSATYYNRIGYKSAVKTGDYEMKNLFIYNEGTNQVCNKKYRLAIDSLHKAIPNLIKLDDYDNVLSSYYYLGKAYEGLKNSEKAFYYYVKIDSIYNNKKSLYPEFIDGYPFIINYYKDKGDKINQLKYITRYMSLDSILQKDYKELNKLIHRKYDIPLMVKEKEDLILSLDKKNSLRTKLVAGLLLIVIIISLFSFYQFRQNKLYKARFKKILENNSIEVENKTETHVLKTEIEFEKIKTIGISEELINQVLKQLQEFESKKGFLKSSITIQMLSEEFDTNSKYLSRIVNEYKNKNFTQYINDLRIEFALNHLQKNKKARKYTIQALSNEYGFNNAESFSTAFYKKTGIKPSFYINELENIKIIKC
jgi:AraC-like DNA-binding protein